MSYERDIILFCVRITDIELMYTSAGSDRFTTRPFSLFSIWNVRVFAFALTNDIGVAISFSNTLQSPSSSMHIGNVVTYWYVMLFR